ncbi:MAG: GxxExxY protein [Thermoguttaceae bacterium]
MTELLYKEEVYTIIGAAIEVHRELGCGFLEAVYQEALVIEFKKNCIPFQSQPEMNISYRGQILHKRYTPDFLCHQEIIVELKALERLSGTEESQIINYLKASGKRVGLLINFGSSGKLEWKRFIY